MKFLKWVGIIIVVFIVIGVIASMGSKQATDTTTPKATTTQPTTTTQPATAPAATKPVNKPTMNMAEFTQLKNGMTYAEAAAIIGGPGEVMSESGSPGDTYYTIMYMYKGEGDMGANSNLMFQGDKLQNKAQFGLK